MDDGDHSQIDTKALIVLSHVYMLFALRVAVHYVRLQGGDVKSVLREARAIVATPDVRRLWQLSANSEIVTRYFIDWTSRRIAIETFLNLWLEQMPFSSALLDFEERRLSDRWITDLVEPIFNDGARKLSVSWENWQDREDMEWFAVDAAINAHECISGQYKAVPPQTKLPGLPTDLNLPVNDPEPYNRIIPGWFLRDLGVTLKKWVPIFEGIIETEGQQRARTKVENAARLARRRQANSRSYEEDETKADINHPLFNNPYPGHDELAERQSYNEAVRRAIASVAQESPQAANYLTQFMADNDISKKDAAVTIGRNPRTARRYHQQLESALAREGIKPTKKSTKNHPHKKK